MLAYNKFIYYQFYIKYTYIYIQMSQDKSFKVIVIGAPGSGKSCILNRYTKNEFAEGYCTTLGVEFTSKIVKIDEDTKIKLQIWDTAGQESFRSIIKTFYRNVSAVFLVYNIASLTTFKQLEFWYSQAIENCNPDIIFILLGAQSDRQSQRQVTKDMAEEFMHKKDIAFMFQTSAKKNSNIDIAFEEAAKQIFLKRISDQIQKNSILKSKNNKKSKSCCS